MFFNNKNFTKIIILFGFSLLVACANKQALVETDPLLESERIQVDKEQEQFKQALGLIQTDNAQEKDLLKAKDILDALYQGNSAYLGALINSADISLNLKKLEEAKKLYLEAIQRIESQKVASQKVESPKEGSVNTKQEVSEHISMFTVHTYNQLGLIERQLGQFDQAEAHYRQALALDADNPTSLKNLAILLDLYRGKLAEALVLYEQYKTIVADSDPKLKDWIYDLKNRLPVEETHDE